MSECCIAQQSSCMTCDNVFVYSYLYPIIIKSFLKKNLKTQSNQIKAEDSAIETKIVLLADAMESKGTKFEDNSIKYQVDVSVENATMKAKVDEVKKHEDLANSGQEIPDLPIKDPPFKEIIANTNAIKEDVEKLNAPQDCAISDQDIPEKSNDSITNVIAVDEFQNDPDKLIDHSISDDVNKEKIASAKVAITILNANAKDAEAKDANAKDAKAIDANAKDANAKVANVTDANASPVDAKVVEVDRNIVDNKHLIESELSKSIKDKLEEKQKQAEVAEIIKKAPDNDVANQFRELLKSINIDKFKSRKVGVSKLTSRVSLQKMISFVVYTSDRITSYSANMVRWAGRASLVIMNQEENDLDTYTSKDSNNISCAVLDSALGGAKLYYFRPLAKAAVIILFEICFSALMDTRNKLYKFTFLKTAIISLLWEVLLKLLTTLIWQKRHNDQCTVVVGDISFLNTTNVFRGECRSCSKAMKDKSENVCSVEGLANPDKATSVTCSPSPKNRVTKVMVANLTNKWDKMWSIEVNKSSV